VNGTIAGGAQIVTEQNALKAGDKLDLRVCERFEYESVSGARLQRRTNLTLPQSRSLFSTIYSQRAQDEERHE